MLEFKNQVDKVLNQIRPFLNDDGGDIELVEALEKEGVIKVRFVGNCKDCDFKSSTFKIGVEKIIMQEIPLVKQIIEV